MVEKLGPQLATLRTRCDYFRRFGRACASADAATDLVRALLRPSRSTADAFLATMGEVCFEFRLAN